eukprot:1946689-Rhodomonas_salina.2
MRAMLTWVGATLAQCVALADLLNDIPPDPTTAVTVAYKTGVRDQLATEASPLHAERAARYAMFRC